jgi:hypothetical protein
MLIAGPTPVRDPLPSKKREITLHPRLHRAATEVAIFLTVPLAVKNCCLQARRANSGAMGGMFSYVIGVTTASPPDP